MSLSKHFLTHRFVLRTRNSQNPSCQCELTRMDAPTVRDLFPYLKDILRVKNITCLNPLNITISIKDTRYKLSVVESIVTINFKI